MNLDKFTVSEFYQCLSRHNSDPKTSRKLLPPLGNAILRHPGVSLSAALNLCEGSTSRALTEATLKRQIETLGIQPNPDFDWREQFKVDSRVIGIEPAAEIFKSHFEAEERESA